MGILDNAKQVASAVHEINNLELYQRVLNLHSDIIELVEENNRLRDESKELLKTISLKKVMVFKEPFYEQDGDKTPYCPACWETKNIPVHVVFNFDGDEFTRRTCPSCTQYYDVPRGRGRGLDDPWGR